MRPLYKTTLVIWSDDDTADFTMRRIGNDVDQDNTFCSTRECVLVQDPEGDEDWEETDFFDDIEDEVEEGIDYEDEDEDEEEDDDLEEEDEEVDKYN